MCAVRRIVFGMRTTRRPRRTKTPAQRLVFVDRIWNDPKPQTLARDDATQGRADVGAACREYYGKRLLAAACRAASSASTTSRRAACSSRPTCWTRPSRCRGSRSRPALNPWVNEVPLVAKPDQLIKRRARWKAETENPWVTRAREQVVRRVQGVDPREDGEGVEGRQRVGPAHDVPDRALHPARPVGRVLRVHAVESPRRGDPLLPRGRRRRRRRRRQGRAAADRDGRRRESGRDQGRAAEPGPRRAPGQARLLPRDDAQGLPRVALRLRGDQPDRRRRRDGRVRASGQPPASHARAPPRA